MYDTMSETARVSVIRRRPVLSGAAVGLGWGISMRAWMRFISANPEFSWSGTIFILGASVICGAILGLAWHRRARGGAGWWRLSFASLLLLGAGGAVMWPAVALGAIAIARPRPSWLRAILGLGAVASQIPVIGGIADNWRFGVGEVALATLWYAPMLAAEAWAFSVAFRPSLEHAQRSVRLRYVLIALSPVVVGFVLLTTGIAGDM
jgi:hypothetical protein